MVLEGKGVYLKKVNKWITLKVGLILLRQRIQGKGSEDGRFIGRCFERSISRKIYHNRTICINKK